MRDKLAFTQRLGPKIDDCHMVRGHHGHHMTLRVFWEACGAPHKSSEGGGLIDVSL